MPAATSSRRKTARPQISSDIEEDNPTQNGAQDDVDDADEEPRRVSKNVKKEKKSTSKRIHQPENHPDPDGDDDDDGDDSRIDVDNFHDQPLGKADLPKLRGLSMDWVAMGKKIHQSWNVVGDVAVSMADVAEGDERERGLAELDFIMKDHIDVEAEMQSHEKAVEEIHQKVAQGEDIDDVVRRYQVGVEKRMKEYVKKTTRQKYAKSNQYVAFKQGIYEVNHPGEAMPPITDFIPREDGDDSDDDDDLEMGGVTQDYKCPITLTALEKPLTSEVCGHSFSGEAIRQFFRGMTALKACPASGCNKSFRLSDCKPDKDLAKKVKAWTRRTQRMEEDSDGEEVIE